MHIFVATYLGGSYYTLKQNIRKVSKQKKKGEGLMKQLMNTSLKKASEKERTAVLRLEMDYELATLFEAIEEKNEKKMKECKQKLEKIRMELLRLKAF
jgi:predicted GNAT family N-acyltransferase